MVRNKLWFSALLCLIFTSIWLILMIISAAKTGPINSFEQAIVSVMNAGNFFQLNYINAVLITIATTIFLVCLYDYCKSLNAQWSLIGFVFVPIYSIMNMFVYFSQITIIPRLLTLMKISANPDIYTAILGQFVQGWSGSAIAVTNQLAYAILGIPSIIFGGLLIKDKRVSTLGGWLLALNGVSCIIGIIGTVANSEILAVGSVIGGALFLFSLVAIVVNMRFVKLK